MSRKRKDNTLYHEILKQASIYSYGKNDNLPKEVQSLESIDNSETGFHAEVLSYEDNIIIAYRGTNFTSKQDIRNDKAMFEERFPQQAVDAIKLYDSVKQYNPKSNITITGHSLGGSLAQIVGSIRGAEAVTFNAYGTGNILKQESRLQTDNIVNYINEFDPIAVSNIENQVGETYVVPQKKIGFSHNLETLADLDLREYCAPEDLKEKQNIFKNRINDISKAIEEKFYEKNIKLEDSRILKKETLKKQVNNMNQQQCVGSYEVKGYTRANGTKVSDYIRTCGAAHASNSGNSLRDSSNDIIIDENPSIPVIYQAQLPKMSSQDLLSLMYKGNDIDSMSSWEIDRMLEDLI